MIGNCGSCQFSKEYADKHASKNGVMVYCGYFKKASHRNGLCDEYMRDNARALERVNSEKMLKGRCARCGFTWFAHQLAGMADVTCDEWQAPALAQQDELFALETVVKRRGASMENNDE